MRRSGLAFRAGIREKDVITRINNVYTDDMTLREAQRLIRKSGKCVQIFVQGFVSIHSFQCKIYMYYIEYFEQIRNF